MFRRHKQPKLPVEGRDFELFDHPDYPDQSMIRLLSGQFKGLEYGVTTVRLIPRDPYDPRPGAKLHFKFGILGDVLANRGVTEKDPDLIQTVGDIIMCLLADQTESKLEIYDDWRKDDGELATDLG